MGFTCVVPTRHDALSYLPVFTWVLPAWCLQDMAPCLPVLTWIYLRGADKTRRLVLSTCLRVGFTCVVLCLIYLSSRGFYLGGALSYLPVFTWVLPAWCRQDTAPCLIYLSSRGFYLRGADKTRCLVSSTSHLPVFTWVLPAWCRQDTAL